MSRILFTGGVPAPGVVAPGGLLRGVPGGDPPGMVTAVGGKHPTGMHSCFECLSVQLALTNTGRFCPAPLSIGKTNQL